MRGKVLWEAPLERKLEAWITRFARELPGDPGGTRRRSPPLPDYDALYRWSVEDVARFWKAFWDFAQVLHSGEVRRVLSEPRMPGARWFEGVRLNYAENLLRAPGDRTAIIFECEDESIHRTLSFGELRDLVARAARGLRALGVRPGDRVAALTPNVPEAVAAMLATSSLGAIWSSCSPEFGLQGVLDRFGQIEPKVLFAADGYVYGGKRFGLEERLRAVLERLPAVEHTVVYEHLGPPVRDVRGLLHWKDFVSSEKAPLLFERFAFDHPLAILYTSGTTGIPKCILHGAGGTLIKHLEEHMLQVDVKAEDVFFYFTTCGWMMWNWLVSGLALGATIVLYDGSPLHPDPGRLFRMAERNAVTIFGTSPRYLAAVEKSGLVPRERYRLEKLRTILSTGSPLHPSQFEWVYEAIKNDVHLASISGGTDIIGCFVLGCPLLPVRAGEIQCRALGMKVESVDEEGRPLIGEKGELVCSAPFPSMPLGFWNDPDESRYRAAYFERFPGRWHHGDYIEITPEGSAVIYGRSDATLNPGGVRIGTAEIYRQVEKLPEIADCLAVGRRVEGDERIVLFVVPAPGVELDEALKEKIRRTIREGASPRHVPHEIHAVPEIPRTISGKSVELAVAKIIHGEEVRNRDALANPEALDYFRRFASPSGETGAGS